MLVEVAHAGRQVLRPEACTIEHGHVRDQAQLGAMRRLGSQAASMLVDPVVPDLVRRTDGAVQPRVLAERDVPSGQAHPALRGTIDQLPAVDDVRSSVCDQAMHVGWSGPIVLDTERRWASTSGARVDRPYAVRISCLTTYEGER